VPFLHSLPSTSFVAMLHNEYCGSFEKAQKICSLYKNKNGRDIGGITDRFDRRVARDRIVVI
jgi:hypothetical protein